MSNEPRVETPEGRVARVPHVTEACDDEGCYCPEDVFWRRMLGDDDPCAPSKDWAAAAFGPLDEDDGGCDCEQLCSMGPTCPGGILARLPGSGCDR